MQDPHERIGVLRATTTESKMINLLFLDDEPWRHEELDKHLNAFNSQANWINRFDAIKPATVEVTHVWNYERCIKALSKYQFDLVSLDHDISDPDDIPFTTHAEWVSKIKTGADVAKWMNSDAFVGKVYTKHVIVHSWNPAGATTMMSELASFHRSAIAFGEDYFEHLFQVLPSIVS